MNLQKLLPANLGAEPKKVAALGGLVVLLVGVYLFNRTSSGGPDTPAAVPSAVPGSAPAPAPAPVRTTTPPITRPASRTDSGINARGGNISDFKPTLKLPEGTDVSRIDPSLHLDLLAKVRNAPSQGGASSLFEFSQPPPPPPPAVKPIVPTTPPVATPPTQEPPSGPPPEPKPPPPPPITLKFYGYAGTTRGGARRAFFLDGDDILVAGENETLKNRFKIIRIGVNSAVVEDVTNKNQQTIPLAEEL